MDDDDGSVTPRAGTPTPRASRTSTPTLPDTATSNPATCREWTLTRMAWDVKDALSRMTLSARMGSETFPTQSDMQVTQDGIHLAALIAVCPQDFDDLTKTHCLMTMPSDLDLQFKDIKARYRLYLYSCPSDLSKALGRACSFHLGATGSSAIFAGASPPSKQDKTMKQLRKELVSTKVNWDERLDESGGSFNIVTQTTDQSGTSSWTAPPVMTELSDSSIASIAPAWRGRKVFAALCHDLHVSDAPYMVKEVPAKGCSFITNH